MAKAATFRTLKKESKEWEKKNDHSEQNPKFSSIRKTTRMSIHIYELSEVMVKLKANQVVGIYIYIY